MTCAPVLGEIHVLMSCICAPAGGVLQVPIIAAVWANVLLFRCLWLGLKCVMATLVVPVLVTVKEVEALPAYIAGVLNGLLKLNAIVQQELGIVP